MSSVCVYYGDPLTIEYETPSHFDGIASPSSLARPFSRNIFATPLEVFLPPNVFREFSGDLLPFAFRRTRQLDLVHNQEIQKPQFPANSQAFR